MAFLPVLIQFFTVAVKDGQFTAFVITHCSLLEQVRGSETWNRVFWLTTWPAVWGYLTHFGLLVLFPQENILKSMSDLLAMLRRVFIEKRSAKVIYMCDRWNDNEKQSQLYLFSATCTTAINGFFKRFLVLTNFNSLIWTKIASPKMRRSHLRKLVVRLGNRLELVNACDLPEDVIDICCIYLDQIQSTEKPIAERRWNWPKCALWASWMLAEGFMTFINCFLDYR